MDIASKAEIKIAGDEYAGFYSCGLTMLGSSTMRRFGDAEEKEGRFTMRSEDGLCLTAVTTKSPYSEAYEVHTSFVNNSDSTVTLEMMTSFLLPGIKADRIHRILSFWSSEGRVKTDDLRELNMSMRGITWRFAWRSSAMSVPCR